MKRKISNGLLDIDEDKRRQSELDSFKFFKQSKDPKGELFIIRASWINRWIKYLNGKRERPGRIKNEKLY